MIFILLFMLILNIVAIALTYYSLSNLDKKEKIIFVAIGIAIMYMITSIVYWISTRNIEIKEVSEIGKNLITFIFVPVNSILTLPIIAKSYNKYKMGALAGDKLRNRIIAIAIPFIIILIIECSYFKSIQNGVAKLVESNQNTNSQVEQNVIEDMNNQEEQNIVEDINNQTEQNIVADTNNVL